MESQQHGACFDAKTGDIEDAPSLDALQSYKVPFSIQRLLKLTEVSIK